MIEGFSDRLEFLGTDGVYWRARLTHTEVILGGFQTVNPKWLTWDGVSPRAEIDWIEYLGHDREVWRARVHCRLSHVVRNGRHIDTWFEHVRSDSAARHEASRMSFLDWQGKKWIATVQLVVEPFPAAPRFRLERLAG